MTDIEKQFDSLVQLFKNAIGIRSADPVDGMKASGLLFIITFASNFVGLWATIVLDILFGFLFLVHLARYLYGRFR